MSQNVCCYRLVNVVAWRTEVHHPAIQIAKPKVTAVTFFVGSVVSSDVCVVGLFHSWCSIGGFTFPILILILILDIYSCHLPPLLTTTFPTFVLLFF